MSAALLMLFCPTGRSQTTLPSIKQSVGDLEIPVNGTATVIRLDEVFELDGVSGNVVQFDMNTGRMNVELFPLSAPLTVSNFMNYVNDGDYINHIVHRSVPGFVIQGGRVSVNGTGTNFTLPVVLTDPPVANEFNQSNLRGTISMARRGGQTNSATSQWFINLADNINLDFVDGGFTVFGRTIGTSITVADQIATLPRCINCNGFDELPVYNFSGFPLEAENYVTAYSVTNIPIYPTASASNAVLFFSVSNSNPSLVSAVVSGSRLTLGYASNMAGQASITLTASDTHTNVVDETFSVTVLSTFAFWKQARFSPAEQADEAVSGPLADPEGDRLANLAEYVMNLDPRGVDAEPTSSSLIAENGTNYICLTYPRVIGLSDATTTAEESSDLQAWSAAVAEEISVTPSGAVELVTLKIQPPPTGFAQFARLLFSLIAAP